MKALVKKFRAYLHKLANDISADRAELKSNLKNDWNKIPNLFTEARLVFSSIPGLILLFNSDNTWLVWFAAILFLLIASTDKIDGYLARKLDQVTRLGEALDPAVDKVLISITLMSLAIVDSLVWIKAWMAFIILCEMVVVWLSFRAKHQKTAVAVTYFGKVKMVIQCAAIFILFIPVHFVLLVYQVVLLATVVITVASLIVYLFKFYIWRKSSKVYDRD